MRVILCESCGSPLDAAWDSLAVICRYCGAHNVPGSAERPVALRVPVDSRPRVNLGGRTYVIESRLGEGDSSVVYRARWVVRLGELVVLKVLHARSDADLLRAEWTTLRALSRSRAQGAAHYVSRLPQPIAHGIIEADGPRVASVFGWKSGFVHTLHEVGNLYDSGVPGPVVVWILKRLLELLDFVHRAGFVHGAVTPDHILIHPYDHGAMLVGWTASGAVGERLRAQSATWSQLYGDATLATPKLDIAMACRCVRAVAVGLPRLHPVLDRGASGQIESAWALRQQLLETSEQIFGPPAYHPLQMPGWKRTG